MADHEKSAKWDILTLFLEAELLEKALVSHHELDHLKKHIPSPYGGKYSAQSPPSRHHRHRPALA